MKRIIVAHEKLDSLLSPLEQDVLSILWNNKKMRVREIYSVVRRKRKVAISSVAVILDRLHENKIVSRDIERARGGVRYIYYSTGDRQTFEKNALEAAVNKLMGQFGSSAVSYFNERFGKR